MRHYNGSVIGSMEYNDEIYIELSAEKDYDDPDCVDILKEFGLIDIWPRSTGKATPTKNHTINKHNLSSVLLALLSIKYKDVFLLEQRGIRIYSYSQNFRDLLKYQMDKKVCDDIWSWILKNLVDTDSSVRQNTKENITIKSKYILNDHGNDFLQRLAHLLEIDIQSLYSRTRDEMKNRISLFQKYSGIGILDPPRITQDIYSGEAVESWILPKLNDKVKSDTCKVDLDRYIATDRISDWTYQSLHQDIEVEIKRYIQKYYLPTKKEFIDGLLDKQNSINSPPIKLLIDKLTKQSWIAEVFWFVFDDSGILQLVSYDLHDKTNRLNIWVSQGRWHLSDNESGKEQQWVPFFASESLDRTLSKIKWWGSKKKKGTIFEDPFYQDRNAIGPCRIVCSCGLYLTIHRPGRYKCRECGERHIFDENFKAKLPDLGL